MDHWEDAGIFCVIGNACGKDAGNGALFSEDWERIASVCLPYIVVRRMNSRG